MKLFFLEPSSRTAINVTRLNRCGYEIRRLIIDWTTEIAALVVLADGTPDDIVVGILSYHLNGEKVIGLVKSSKATPLGVFSQLKTYLSINIERILVLIDQEDKEPDELFIQVKERYVSEA